MLRPQDVVDPNDELRTQLSEGELTAYSRALDGEFSNELMELENRFRSDSRLFDRKDRWSSCLDGRLHRGISQRHFCWTQQVYERSCATDRW